MIIGYREGKSVVTTFEDVCVTGLGKEINKTKEFSNNSLGLTFEALNKFKEILLKEGVDGENLLVSATEASRVAKNFHKLKDFILKELKTEVVLLSPDEEAEYTSFGASLDPSLDKREGTLFVDIGGASTEIVCGEYKKSFPIGTVREKGRELEFFESYWLNCLSDRNFFPTFLIGIAGTFTSIATMLEKKKNFSYRYFEGKKYSVENFLELSQNWIKSTNSELLKSYPFLGKRSEVIKEGLMITQAIVKTCGIETFSVSATGLRHGLLFCFERFSTRRKL